MNIVICLNLAMVICATVDARNMVSRIINGVDAISPFYAYLEIFEQSDFGGRIFFGGATILSSTTIITCAQNVARFKSWRIGVGANRISNMQWFYATEAIMHPEYNTNTLDNNIALIYLALGQELPLNSDTIRSSIRILNPITYPPPGWQFQIFGFGFGHTNNQPEMLQTTEVIVTSNEECEMYYPHMKRSGMLVSNFCGRNDNSFSNMCAGDQGGPLLVVFPTGTDAVLVGIQSFIRISDCSNPQAQPPVFVRIAWYSTWISNNILRPSSVVK